LAAKKRIMVKVIKFRLNYEMALHQKVLTKKRTFFVEVAFLKSLRFL